MVPMVILWKCRLVDMYCIKYIYLHSLGESILCPEYPLWTSDNLWESAINKTDLTPAGMGLTVSLCVLKVSVDQQCWHHLGICEKSKILTATERPAVSGIWEKGPSSLCFSKLPGGSDASSTWTSYAW